MIIDIHAHLWDEELPSKSWWDTFVKISVSLSGRSEERIRSKTPGWWDKSGDMLVSDMDEAGIDKTVLLPLDYALLVGCGESTSLEKQHIIMAEAVKRHPDRLILFAGIDPRRPDAVEFLERAVKEWKVKGLKIHPAMGFYPNEPRCYLLYQKCLELGLPVLSHTGPELYPMMSKYAMPVFFDEIANDFPELKLVMAHAGACYWEETALIASNKLNMYMDLSWWQAQYLGFSEAEFYGKLKALVSVAGTSRVLLGSDWPAMRQVRKLNHAAWTNVIKEASERAKQYGITFTQEEVDGIMGNNAAKILGL